MLTRTRALTPTQHNAWETEAKFSQTPAFGNLLEVSLPLQAAEFRSPSSISKSNSTFTTYYAGRVELSHFSFLHLCGGNKNSAFLTALRKRPPVPSSLIPDSCLRGSPTRVMLAVRCSLNAPYAKFLKAGTFLSFVL